MTGPERPDGIGGGVTLFTNERRYDHEFERVGGVTHARRGAQSNDERRRQASTRRGPVGLPRDGAQRIGDFGWLYFVRDRIEDDGGRRTGREGGDAIGDFTDIVGGTRDVGQNDPSHALPLGFELRLREGGADGHDGEDAHQQQEQVRRLDRDRSRSRRHVGDEPHGGQIFTARLLGDEEVQHHDGGRHEAGGDEEAGKEETHQRPLSRPAGTTMRRTALAMVSVVVTWV